MMRNIIYSSFFTFVVFVIAPHPIALAQQSGASGQLEEIVVTALRREENLQEVPISIVAISGADMEIRSIQTIDGRRPPQGGTPGQGRGGVQSRARGAPR